MSDSPACRKAGAGLFALSVVLASAPSAGVASTVSCKIPQPCALYTNGTGAGLEGLTTFAATSSSNVSYGLEGLDSSSNKNRYNAGVYGYSPYGTGLRGYAPSGDGVVAVSTTGTGLSATSSSGNAIVGASSTSSGILGKTAGTSSSHTGVTGSDVSTNFGNNVGVLGTTVNGGYGVEGTAGAGAVGGVYGVAPDSYGVRGSSSSSVGVYGSSVSSLGMYGSGATGVQGYSPAGFGLYASSVSGTGVRGVSSSGPGIAANSVSGDAIDAVTSGGIGAYVVNSNGNGADVGGSYIGVVARSNSYPLLLTNAASADLFYVDGSGNVYSHGTYRTFAATRDGAESTAFTTRSTAPNVEDVGGARLVNGVATVAFDAAFSASMDAHSAYHVFLTPNGDTRGLYVALKTAGGFVVRETQGGHGTLDFDYRIVAAAPGRAQERMALIAPALEAGPRAALVSRRAVPVPKAVPPQTHAH